MVNALLSPLTHTHTLSAQKIWSTLSSRLVYTMARSHFLIQSRAPDPLLSFSSGARIIHSSSESWSGTLGVQRGSQLCCVLPLLCLFRKCYVSPPTAWSVLQLQSTGETAFFHCYCMHMYLYVNICSQI